MASAIGWERGVVWSESRRKKGTAVWFDNRLGGPPLRFGPLPEGRKNRVYTKAERSAVVHYAVEQRRTKSVDECAAECGTTGSSLSRWIRDECRAYPEVAAVKPDVYAGKITDYRTLLVDLREWSGTRSICLFNYFKGSVGGCGLNRGYVPAVEFSGNGHPYFPPVERESRRIFTNDQKKRRVSYWHSGLGGDSVKKYARECGLFPSTPYERIDGVGEDGLGESSVPEFSGDRASPNSECESLRDTSLHGVERLWSTSAEEGTSARFAGHTDGPPPSKRQKQREGTATWLDNRFGGPPLRFSPLPEGRTSRVYTEEERGAVVDYTVEQREVKSADECAKDVGIHPTCISKWLSEACKTYRAFSELDLDKGTLRVIDYRKLLPDLRTGKTLLCMHDYTGGEKFAKSKRGQKWKGVRVKEETRNGHLYFASPEKGERRVFSEAQKERAVDYWLGEFGGDAISNCAKAINLGVHTLTDWVDTYGRGRRRCLLHTTESPESSPETAVSDPNEDSSPNIPWQEAKGRR
ncbi:MAG: hypothetical protein OXF02_00595 [Simkaniaceae bacterium]|nr:hypothetical protein [Simkaniaceae bacterium]